MSGYVPISKRPADLTLAIVFGLKAVIAIFSDYINAIGPSNPLTKEAVDAMCQVWPPKWFCDIFWDTWIPKDPLLLQNPVWMKWGCLFSVFIYTPFYLVAIYALMYQKRWIREPMLIWSWGLIMTMIFIIAENFYGPHRTSDPVLLLLVYGIYIACPIYTLIKYWSPSSVEPRQQQSSASKQKKKN